MQVDRQQVRDAIDRGVLRHLDGVHSDTLIDMADTATDEVMALLAER